MKRFLLYAGLVGALGLSQIGPAKADAWVDTPSFGRIVYGITGGAVILPQDAWEGYYVAGAPNPTTPASDATFTSGASSKYLGDDTFAATWQGKAWLDLGTNTIQSDSGDITALINATQYNNDTTPWTISGGLLKDTVASVKVAYVSSYGLGATVSLKDSSGSHLLHPAGPVTGALSSITVNDPFAIEYTTNTTSGPTTWASDILSPANHFKAYQANGLWYVGIEDWNSTTKRWDWNDTVIVMDITPVPEPAFFQMSGLLTLGAFGLMRLRRRSK